MRLLCMVDTRYPSSGDEYESFKAGEVYEVADALGARLLLNEGPADRRRDKTGNGATTPQKWAEAPPEAPAVEEEDSK